MVERTDNRVEGLVNIERSSLAPDRKRRAMTALGSMAAFYDQSEDRWLREIDFAFLAIVLMRLATSGSVDRALSGDLESDKWFDDESLEEKRSGATFAIDESLGKRREEAAVFLDKIGDPMVRSLVSEALGMALLLQMSEQIVPKDKQDFLFLAESAAHTFSSADVMRLWKN